MTNLNFEDDDLRQFEQNDLMWGPCPLLAALYADTRLDEAWHWGEYPTYQESFGFWSRQRDASLETGMVLVWQLCCEYMNPKGTN